MANTFKNIKKKLRRKRLLAEKRHLEKAQAGAGGNEAARRKIKAALRRKKAVLKPVAVDTDCCICGLGRLSFSGKKNLPKL